MKKFLLGILPAIVIASLLIFTSRDTSNKRENPIPEFNVSEFQSRIKDLDTTTLEKVSEDITTLTTDQKEDPFEGESREVKTGDKIRVFYRGWTATDGAMFDQSFNHSADGYVFNVGGGVIEGWSDGVLGMKVGEVRRLYIPSVKGYGEAGNGSSIPGNADIIFDVELVRFED